MTAQCVEVMFVSVWDGGCKIISKAKLDQEKNKLNEIEMVDVSELDLEVLEREYVILPDGTEIPAVRSDETKYTEHPMFVVYD